MAVLAYQSLGIYALALGYLAGAAVQCIVLWVALAHNGFRFRFRFDIRDSTLRETANLVFYPLAGQVLGELRTLLENFCASFYAPGILSALRYASRIIHAISGVVMSSVVTATTPMVAHYVAEKEMDEMALMTPYILFSRTISIMQTPFYAVKDTKTLCVSMVWSLLGYLMVIGPLLYFFRIYGFPLGTSLATALGTLVMCFLAHRAFGPMGWNRLSSFAVRMAGAMAISCAGFIGGNLLRTDFGRGGFLGNCIAAAIPSLIGMSAFGIGAVVFRLMKPVEMAQKFALLGSRKLRWPLSTANVDPVDSE